MKKIASRLRRRLMRTRKSAERWWQRRALVQALDISSGDPTFDRFLRQSYYRVPGMSSRFAAAICGQLIQRQTDLAIDGDIVEIGTLEGRFFIAMALGLSAGQKAVAIDRFQWPDSGIEQRFIANCAAHGITSSELISWKADSRQITSDALRDKLSKRAIRFAHIDGDHTSECVTGDLELIQPLMHENGIICLDDMLHPAYPTLITPVLDYLDRHPEMQLFCIIDREDITGAPKFLLCRGHARALYEDSLRSSFSKFCYHLPARLKTHSAFVLTPRPGKRFVDQ